MKKKTFGDDPILRAFVAMIEAGLPVYEFVPDDKTDEGDFTFSRILTPAEVKKAREIAERETGGKWSFIKAAAA